MTPRACLSSEELAGFIRGFGSDDHKRHVARCEACKRRVSFLQRIVSAGAGPIADIAAEVDELVGKLRAAPRSTWWKVVLEPEYRRPDVARRLLSLAIDARLRDRHLAVDFTKAATTIVDKIADGTHHDAELRFEAWKFASAMLREVGRYEEAGLAFVNAEDAARGTSDPELAQASVFLSRALFHAEPDVWNPEEASALLDRAERVFVQRDAARLRAAVTARAVLLFRSGDAVAAREQWLTVLAETPKTDREQYLNALSNFMFACVELHETNPDVEESLTFLIDENTALGRTVQVARARWFLGRVHRDRREYDPAISLLRSAMSAIGDADSSIRIGLDVIETLLLDERHDEAFSLARELASAAVLLDDREPSRRHGLTAQVFAYLREAAQRQALTADLVADIGRYLDRITRQRPFDFVPPMPLADM